MLNRWFMQFLRNFKLVVRYTFVSHKSAALNLWGWEKKHYFKLWATHRKMSADGNTYSTLTLTLTSRTDTTSTFQDFGTREEDIFKSCKERSQTHRPTKRQTDTKTVRLRRTWFNGNFKVLAWIIQMWKVFKDVAGRTLINKWMSKWVTLQFVSRARMGPTIREKAHINWVKRKSVILKKKGHIIQNYWLSKIFHFISHEQVQFPKIIT